MATHSAVDQKADFIALTRRVLTTCLVLTVVSTVVAAAVGPILIRLLFGFRDGVGAVTFLAMGVSVGLYLVAMILAQALLGRGMHAWTTAGWLIGLAAMVAGALLPGSAVEQGYDGLPAGCRRCRLHVRRASRHRAATVGLARRHRPSDPARAAVFGQSGAVAR